MPLSGSHNVGDSGHTADHNLIDAAIGAVQSSVTAEATARAAADAVLQPLDADLTVIAALDSATAGVLATDGTGWVRKTYAQLKTALGLVKADVGLGNVDNTADASKPVSTAQAAADAAVQAAAVQRVNHTGTQLAVTVSDFSTAALAATSGAYVASADGVSFTWNGNPVTLGGGAATLTPTAVKTGAYTAAAGDLVPVDTTSGAVTVTLPTAPADKTQVAVKHVIQGGTNAVTVLCGGSAVINKAAGATSMTLPLLAQAVILQYKASTSIWYVLADDLPLAQLDTRFASLAGGNRFGAANRTDGVWMPMLVTNRASQTGILGAQVNQALYDATGKKTWMCWLGPRRRLNVSYFDHLTRQFSASVVVPQNYALPLDDNHGVPSMCMDANGRLHILWGVHNASPLYAKMTNPRDLTTWTTSTLSGINASTYHTVVFDPVSQKLFAIFRSGSGHGASYPAHEFGGLMISANAGTTWTETSGGIVDCTVYNADADKDFYISDVQAVNGRIYFAWTIAHGATHDGPRSDWFCAYYDPATGHVYTLDGTDRGTKLGATQADLLAARAATFTYGQGAHMVVNSDGTVVLAANYQTSDNMVSLSTAKWNGTAWTVSEKIGPQTNNVGVVSGIRRNSAGTYEVFGLSGNNNPISGQTYYTSTGTAEPIPYAKVGFDLVVLTSSDGVTWGNQKTIMRKEQSRGPGIQGVSVPNGSHDDLKVLAIPAEMSTSTSTSGGYGTTRLPIYALSDSNIEPMEAIRSFGHQGVMTEYFDRFVEVNNVAAPTTGAWTTLDCSAVLPPGTTEVNVRVAAAGNGTAGIGGVGFRFPGQTQNAHLNHSIRTSVTDSIITHYWVPVGPDQEIEYFVFTNTVNLSLHLCGVRIEE